MKKQRFPFAVMTLEWDLYLALLFAVLNAAWFVSEKDWNSLGFFVAASILFVHFGEMCYVGGAAAAVLLATMAAILFRSMRQSRVEGMDNENEIEIDDADDDVDARRKEEEEEDAAKAKAKANAANAANAAKGKTQKMPAKDAEAFKDMFSGSDTNLEKLMDRQTVLMKQLKNMAPLMQSAKEALKQLPAGYLEKALKTLKTNLKKNPSAL